MENFSLMKSPENPPNKSGWIAIQCMEINLYSIFVTTRARYQKAPSANANSDRNLDSFRAYLID